jgi:tripartite-type tricarboxylate transporter receptor subunit TctC
VAEQADHIHRAQPAGGLVDTSARIIAEPLAKLLGATVVIENKAGASGNIAYQQSRWGPRTVILCW